jgi:Recombinase
MLKNRFYIGLFVWKGKEYVGQHEPIIDVSLFQRVQGVLNCSTDGVSLTPTYRKPFDAVFRRAKNQEWSGREDLNLRPPGPETERQQRLAFTSEKQWCFSVTLSFSWRQSR